MSFIVETGSIVAGATSYASIEQFLDYFTDLGDTSVESRDELDIEVALIKGTAYLDSTYRNSFKGRKVIATQSLQFPRYGLTEDGFAVDTRMIPANIIKATCEAANRSFTIDLFKDIKAGESNVVEKTIGPLTKKWAPGTYQVAITYPLIDKLLAGLVDSGYGIIKTVRS